MNAASRPKRKVILRDSLTLLVLALSTLVLFAITSLLFHSFMDRRQQLGREYAERGQQALEAGDADRAILDLRTSLSYAPEQRGNRLLLAEALARANHPAEARSYFLGLLDTQPADGFVNLQLARLARQRKETAAAVSFYRAAAVGNWTGDSLQERFKVQLELAEYLIEAGQLPSARSELMVAASDAPEDASIYTLLAAQFDKAGAPANALAMYRRAIRLEPRNGEVLFRAGQLAYQMNEYAEAARLLAQARRQNAAGALSPQDDDAAQALLHNAHRIQELEISSDLAPQDRVQHLHTAEPIARKRFDSCAAQFAATQLPAPLQPLQAAWTTAELPQNQRALAQDPTAQDNLTKLIFDTEQTTAHTCGAPTDDDALLLELANTARGVH